MGSNHAPFVNSYEWPTGGHIGFYMVKNFYCWNRVEQYKHWQYIFWVTRGQITILCWVSSQYCSEIFQNCWVSLSHKFWMVFYFSIVLIARICPSATFLHFGMARFIMQIRSLWEKHCELGLIHKKVFMRINLAPYIINKQHLISCRLAVYGKPIALSIPSSMYQFRGFA